MPDTATRWVSPAIRNRSTSTGSRPGGVAVDQSRQQPALLGRQPGRRSPQPAAHPPGQPLPPRRRRRSARAVRGRTSSPTASRRRATARACRRPRTRWPGSTSRHSAAGASTSTSPAVDHRRPSATTADASAATDTRGAPATPVAASTCGSPVTVSSAVTSACCARKCISGDARATATRPANGTSTSATQKPTKPERRCSSVRPTRLARARPDEAEQPEPGARATATTRGPSRPSARCGQQQRQPCCSTAAERRAAYVDAPRRDRRAHTVTRSPQFGERDVADARHLVELVDAGEAAVLRAPVEDLLAEHRPDPGQCLELLERRRVEVDQHRRRRSGTGRRTGRRPAARPGTPDDDLLAVLQRRRQVDRHRVDARPAHRRPPAPRRTPGIRRQAIDARPDDLAGDVHDDRRRCGRRRR